MDVAGLLVGGFWASLQPMSLLMMLIGLVWGVLGGAAPGITGSVAMALLLPLTWGMDASTALATLAGVWAGAAYGGGIPAILIRTPGTGGAAATVIDGYELQKQGQAGKALGVSLVCGVIGGTISVILLIPMVLFLGRITLAFGPPEIFAMSVFGLMIISSLEGDNMLKGIASGLFGLLITTVGIDAIVGIPRFTFGNIDLIDGVAIIPVMVGLFAVGEMLYQVSHPRQENRDIDRSVYTAFPSLAELRSVSRAGFIGTVVGLIVGVMPGAGGTVSAFVAYNEAKRFSKHPELFGKGSLEGVAAPETANNAVQGGDLVPALALGIPGGAHAAIMLAALMLHGVRPGPMLLTSEPRIVFNLFAALILTNVMMLPVGAVILKACMRMLLLPRRFVIVGVFCLVVAGAFAVDYTVFQIYVVLFFGVVGYLMRLTGFSVPATVLGLVLGELIESNLRRSLLMSFGSLDIFFTRPITLALLLLSAVVLLYPLIVSLLQRKGGKAAAVAARDPN